MKVRSRRCLFRRLVEGEVGGGLVKIWILVVLLEFVDLLIWFIGASWLSFFFWVYCL